MSAEDSCMKEYKVGTACKKCGERGATTKYVYFMGIENMERKCQNCGYSWYEKPLTIKENE